MNRRLSELTDREKDVLRLLAASHDAKSAAAKLGLSVHTVNERLRTARQKLGVSSSRAAARLLAEAEGRAPKTFVDKDFGEAAAAPMINSAPPPARRPSSRQGWLIGVLLMSVVALTFMVALMGMPWIVPEPYPGSPPPEPVVTPQSLRTTAETSETAVQRQPRKGADPVPAPKTVGPQAAPPDAVAHALSWLALIDRGDWTESWQAASPTFRSRMSQDAWETRAAQLNRPAGPLDRVQQYAVRSASPTNSDAGGSVLVQYQATSPTGVRLLETVALVPDGETWKVSAYFAHGSPEPAPGSKP